MYRSGKHNGRHTFFNKNQEILEKHGLCKILLIIVISIFIIAIIPFELFSITANAEGDRNSDIWLGYNDGYTENAFAWNDLKPWTGCIELDAAKLGVKAGGYAEDPMGGGTCRLHADFFDAYEPGILLSDMLTKAQSAYLDNVWKDCLTLEEFVLIGDLSLKIGGYR
jgi:hypothetical protein